MGECWFSRRTRWEESSRYLYTRRLDQLTAVQLAGTEDALGPFFSPDGTWIAFFASGKLKKVEATGGAPVTLCDAPSPRGGDWTEDGRIVFLPVTGGGQGLRQVPAAGGVPTPFIDADTNRLILNGHADQRASASAARIQAAGSLGRRP